MAKVSMSTDLGVPADRVWDLIGRFNALPDWHPGVERREIEGSVRTLHLAGGGTVTERLEALDDAGKAYTFSIVARPRATRWRRSRGSTKPASTT